MKKLKKDGEVVEEPKVEGEETETEETVETPEEKEETKAIKAKIENIFKSIKENPVAKSVNYKEETSLTRSVMESDSQLRRIRPFVKLSPDMKDFVQAVKDMAKGVIKAALNETDAGSGGYTVPRLIWAL